jgi:hypothetical protein
MLRLRGVLAVGGCAVTLLIGAPVSAFAVGTTPPPTTGGDGGTITVTVTGTGVRGGSAGRPSSRQVIVPSPCWMSPGFTGKEYYEWVKSGRAASSWYHTGNEGPFEPQPGYEKYKDDDKGRWYGGACSSETFNDLDQFFAYADKWFAEHKSVYVPAGVRPPVPPVPPELLRDVASDEMTLPKPEINWNPKRAGDAATLVNLDTWVWLTDRRTSLYVEASADTAVGRIAARVDASLAAMTVSAPGAGTTQCEDGGVPYAPGATGECAIRFTRSSPGGGRTPVTTQTRWTATWSVNGQDRGAIPQQPAAQSLVTNIGVREVHAVVR